MMKLQYNQTVSTPEKNQLKKKIKNMFAGNNAVSYTHLLNNGITTLIFTVSAYLMLTNSTYVPQADIRLSLIHIFSFILILKRLLFVDFK